MRLLMLMQKSCIDKFSFKIAAFTMRSQDMIKVIIEIEGNMMILYHHYHEVLPLKPAIG